jgi:hypothetical protein
MQAGQAGAEPVRDGGVFRQESMGIHRTPGFEISQVAFQDPGQLRIAGAYRRTAIADHCLLYTHERDSIRQPSFSRARLQSMRTAPAERPSRVAISSNFRCSRFRNTMTSR